MREAVLARHAARSVGASTGHATRIRSHCSSVADATASHGKPRQGSAASCPRRPEACAPVPALHFTSPYLWRLASHHPAKMVRMTHMRDGEMVRSSHVALLIRRYSVHILFIVTSLPLCRPGRPGIGHFAGGHHDGTQQHTAAR